MTRATALLACALFLTAALGMACGDDDTNSAPPLEQLAQIGGVAEAAADAWAAVGPAGLYDYLDASVIAHCTKPQLEAALKDQELPTAFQGMESVTFQGADAHATINLIFHNDHRKVEWVFAPTASNWRLINFPGLEKCGRNS